VVEVQVKVVPLLNVDLEGGHDLVGNLNNMPALLADQMVMMIAKWMVLVMERTIDADTRDQPDVFEPLQRSVDCSDINVWLLGHNHGVDRLGSNMAATRFDYLEHQEALGCQSMTLLSQQLRLFNIQHHSLLLKSRDLIRSSTSAQRMPLDIASSALVETQA